MFRFSVLYAVMVASPLVAHAQATSPPQVEFLVCSSAKLSASLQRLVGPAVEIRTFVIDELQRYEDLNQQVLELRNAAAIVHGHPDSRAASAFWLDRLEGHGVQRRRVRTMDHSATEAHLLTQLHDLLVEMFPDKRSEFDLRLYRELFWMQEPQSVPRLAQQP